MALENYKRKVRSSKGLGFTEPFRRVWGGKRGSEVHGGVSYGSTASVDRSSVSVSTGLETGDVDVAGVTVTGKGDVSPGHGNPRAVGLRSRPLLSRRCLVSVSAGSAGPRVDLPLPFPLFIQSPKLVGTEQRGSLEIWVQEFSQPLSVCRLSYNSYHFVTPHSLTSLGVSPPPGPVCTLRSSLL